MILSVCQNIIILNDKHYIESCLLGQIEISKNSFPFPSIAIPDHLSFEEISRFAEECRSIANETWKSIQNLSTTSEIEQASSIAYGNAKKINPEIRVFVDGLRLDEVQLIFNNIKNYIFKDSSLNRAQFWEESNEQIIVIIPDISLKGEVDLIIKKPNDWKPVN